MLPDPAISFTIPSVHDDKDLECRVYHPLQFQTDTEWQKRAAVVAHPYAPLGGCYDDPIVTFVSSILLKQGYVVGTFNFRGAGGSKGHTTWTAKAETDDYTSFLGFMLHYLHFLDPSTVGTSSSSTLAVNSGTRLVPIKSEVMDIEISHDPAATTLIVGGYSYGSLVAMSLPPIEAVLSRFIQALKGSAEAEIILRAKHSSSQWNKEARERQRGRSLTVNAPMSPSSMVYGGEESEPGARRLSRDSRRSVDIVRRSVDRSRKRLRAVSNHDTHHDDPQKQEERLDTTIVPRPKVRYLLISPVLPPIGSLLTMFASFPLFGKHGDGQTGINYEKLCQHDTLAVYGDKDAFTSRKKLHRWAEDLSRAQGSLFRYKEVQGAGHFWHEREGLEEGLRPSVKDWIVGLDQ